MLSIIWVSAKHWILEAQGDAKIQQNKTHFIYSFLFLIFYWTSEPGREATDIDITKYVGCTSLFCI